MGALVVVLLLLPVFVLFNVVIAVVALPNDSELSCREIKGDARLAGEVSRFEPCSVCCYPRTAPNLTPQGKYLKEL